MNIRTRVAVTSEESAPGVPLWGENQIITDVPKGETHAAIENLLAGQRYYVRTWNEDQFGNVSREVIRIVGSDRDEGVPQVPWGRVVTARYRAFEASWDPIPDTDLAEYEVNWAVDDGSGTGPGTDPSWSSATSKVTRIYRGAAPDVKLWVRMRSRDNSNNYSAWSDPLLSVTPTDVQTVTSANEEVTIGSGGLVALVPGGGDYILDGVTKVLRLAARTTCNVTSTGDGTFVTEVELPALGTLSVVPINIPIITSATGHTAVRMVGFDTYSYFGYCSATSGGPTNMQFNAICRFARGGCFVSAVDHYATVQSSLDIDDAAAVTYYVRHNTLMEEAL